MGRTKDEATLVKENRTLKQQNQALKKQLGRLRKKIANLVNVHGLDLPPETDDENSELPVVESEGLKCEKCGIGALKEVCVGIKVFLICNNKSCLWRKKLSG